MKDFESLILISVEYRKVNSVCFWCLKIINSWKHLLEILKSNQMQLVTLINESK